MSKIYICQNSAGSLEVMERYDVDGAIKHAEETDDDLPFTVLGSFSLPIMGTPILVRMKLEGKTIYETVVGDDKVSAIDRIKGLKRYKDKNPTMEVFQDLTFLINAYYK